MTSCEEYSVRRNRNETFFSSFSSLNIVFNKIFMDRRINNNKLVVQCDSWRIQFRCWTFYTKHDGRDMCNTDVVHCVSSFVKINKVRGQMHSSDRRNNKVCIADDELPTAGFKLCVWHRLIRNDCNFIDCSAADVDA